MPATTPPKLHVSFEVEHGGKDLGRFLIELDAEKAPKTVENFLAYVDSGFFDNTIFHRIMSDFMVQGGGYDAAFKLKEKGVRPAITNEAKTGLPNERGTIAMARTNEPHSATSQFFINLKNNTFLNHPGSDGWGYCAFGKIVEGEEVLDRIKAVEVQKDDQLGEKSRPVTPPILKKVARAT